MCCTRLTRLQVGDDLTFNRPRFGSVYILSRLYERLQQVDASAAQRLTVLLERYAGLGGVPAAAAEGAAGGSHQGVARRAFS